MNCRNCDTKLEHLFLDLGSAPPSNAYLTSEALQHSEIYYPLRLYVCTECWLVQTEDYAHVEELFRPDYAYFSSTSISWLKHAAGYCEMIRDRLSLDSRSFVIEVGSNDGYLLQHFKVAGIPCIGIEPTASTAGAAKSLGIEILSEFFGETLGLRLAREYRQADLIIGNNVYAHVPDINDFTRGLKAALKAGGTITLEFPHLMRLIQHTQFDTVYHEHFSYLSLYTVDRIFKAAGLNIWDVEELPTHGGSLRIYGCHAEDNRNISFRVTELLKREAQYGFQTLAPYKDFQAQANRVKDEFLAFLIEKKRAGKKVAAYGAAAKGNTLINYAGVKPDLLPFVCDAAVAKQGKFLPGSHIKILPPEELVVQRPDYIVILPWNIAFEVIAKLDWVREYGGKFVVCVPELQVLG